MDPLTHGLAGAAVKYLGFRRRAAIYVLVVSAVAPDLDYLTRLWGAEVFLRYHRGISHGVAALFLAPAIIGAAFARGRRNFFFYYLLSFVGYGSHIFLDLLSPYGMRALAPLDWQRYSLNLVANPDIFISGGLLLGVLAASMQKQRERARAVAAVTVLLLVTYLGARYYFHERSEEFVRKNLDKYIVVDVVPLPGGVMRWWFIVKGNGNIKTGLSDLFIRRIYVDGVYDAASYDPVIEATREMDVVKDFLYYAKHPFADIERNGGRIVVRWKDLSRSFEPEGRFTATVVMDKKGKVLSRGVRIR